MLHVAITNIPVYIPYISEFKLLLGMKVDKSVFQIMFFSLSLRFNFKTL